MNTIYTLISHTPGEEGWYDRCGDYQPGKESELEIHYFTEKKQAGEALGDAQFNNQEGENTLLINGINPDDWHYILSEEEGKKLEDEFFEIDQIAFNKRQELEAERKKRIEEEKLRKQQEEERKKLQEKLRIEAAEKAELAKLLAKYGQK